MAHATHLTLKAEGAMDSASMRDEGGLSLRSARRVVLRLRPGVHGGEALSLGVEVVDFSSNVSPLGPPPRALRAIKESLNLLNLYPDPQCRAVKEAVAEYLGSVGPDNVIVGCGSTELIHLFALTFVEEGDEALIPCPTFSEYEVCVAKMGGLVKPLMLKQEQGFSLDPEAVLESLSRRTKAIFLCNPNNPTGYLAPREALLKIVREAHEAGALVLIDESYVEFVDEPASLVDLVNSYSNLLVLRSITKPFGMPGLRIGYAVASEEVAGLISRVKTPWSVSVLAQAAAVEALRDRRYLERVKSLVARERRYVYERFRRLRGVWAFPTKANFFLVDVGGTGKTSTTLKADLMKRGILVRDCSSFRGLGRSYIRVAVRRRLENEALLRALVAVLGE
ncbi:MAG: histidinol-phosphate transaminase [Thermoprotei archaeon]|nr:MAG: histidinol-phosphate transaminase [Thermoprotei archaeon]